MHPHSRAVPVPWSPPVHPRLVSQQGGWQLRHQQQIQTVPSVCPQPELCWAVWLQPAPAK